MNELWRRAAAAFDRVLELDVGEREAYLRELPADVRAEVESLLAADSLPSGLLDGGQERLLAPFVAGLESEGEAPERVGPYRLLRSIGRGGMGEVWLAERTDGQFEQRVALKLIKTGLLFEEVERRFLQERQILASLSHPNIAHLVDGGICDDGRPYFAMEFVDGRPLTEFCDERGLDLRARLRLFLHVCEAVRHAHRNLVVHRDLKPGNILVDTDGHVKLLDFGIAKLLDSGAGQQTTVVRMLTPDYAAPEQLIGAPVTTSTDLYALGLILFELLTGERAFVGTGSDHSGAVKQREHPRRPSRSIEDATTRRELVGDLDAIVLRALECDPEDRYPSVDALAGDVRNWLDDLPVTASRGSEWYRVRKWVRRHRGVAVAASVALVAVLAGAGATLRQSQLAAGERDRARASEERATAINDFLINDVLRSAAGAAHERGGSTMVEVLDAAALRVAGSSQSAPLVEAALRRTLGEAYLSVGALDSAVEQLQAAFERSRVVRGEDHPDTLQSLALLARARWEIGRSDEARRTINDVLRRQRELFGADDLGALASQRILGECLMFDGEYRRAEALYRETLATVEREHPRAIRERLHVMAALVTALDMQRKRNEAFDLARATLALQREHLGDRHPDVVRTMGVLARTLGRLERREEAEEIYERAVELSSGIFGAEHPQTAELLSGLSAERYYMRDLEGAEQAAREALTIRRATLGDEHRETATAMKNLAITLRAAGKLDEAGQWQFRVYELDREHRGVEHIQTMKTMLAVGYQLLASEGRSAALEFMREYVTIGNRMADKPDADPVFINDFAWYLLDSDLDELHDPPRALELAERAVALTDRRQNEFLDTLAVAYHRTGDLERAIEVEWEAIRLEDSLIRYDMERQLVALLREAGDDKEIERFLHYNLERRREARPADDPLIATTHRHLGRFYRRLGESARAEKHYVEALRIFRVRHDPTHRHVYETCGELGEMLLDAGRLDDAEPLLVAAHDGALADTNATEAERETGRERLERLRRVGTVARR